MQLQHLWWSTARIENQSGQVLENVELWVDDAKVPLGRLEPGQSRFVRLPKSGGATIRVHILAQNTPHEGCGNNYVEDDMSHVRIWIQPTLEMKCQVEFGLFDRVMLLEMW